VTPEEQVKRVKKILKSSHVTYQAHYQTGLATLSQKDYLLTVLNEISSVVYVDDETFTDEETECS